MAGSSQLKNTVARFTFYVATSTIISKIIGIISLKIFTNILTPDQFGLYNFFVATNTVILGFAILGIPSGMFRYLVKYDVAKEYQQYKDVFFSSMIILFPFLTFLIFLIFFFSIFGIVLFSANNYIILMLGTSIVLYSLMINNLVIYVVRGKLYARTYFLTTVLQPLFIIIFGIIFIKGLGNYDLGLVYGYIVTQYIFSFAYLFKFSSLFKSGHYSREETINVLKYGLPGILPHLLNAFYTYYLIWALQSFFSNSTVALYRVGYTISNSIGLITVLITSGFNSIIYRYYEHNEHQVLSNFLNRTLRVYLLFFVSLTLLTYGISRQLILLVSNNQYLMSRDIVLPLLIDLMLQVIIVYTTQGLGLKNKMSVRAIAYSLGYVFGLTLAVFLIPMYGIVGSALVQLLTDFTLLLVLTPISQYYYSNHFNKYQFFLLTIFIIGGYIGMYTLERLLHSGFIASIIVTLAFVVLCLITKAVSKADFLYAYNLMKIYIPTNVKQKLTFI